MEPSSKLFSTQSCRQDMVEKVEMEVISVAKLCCTGSNSRMMTACFHPKSYLPPNMWVTVDRSLCSMSPRAPPLQSTSWSVPEGSVGDSCRLYCPQVPLASLISSSFFFFFWQKLSSGIGSNLCPVLRLRAGRGELDWNGQDPTGLPGPRQGGQEQVLQELQDRRLQEEQQERLNWPQIH